MSGTGTKWKVEYLIEMFTLVFDRRGDQKPLIHFALVLITSNCR